MDPLDDREPEGLDGEIEGQATPSEPPSADDDDGYAAIAEMANKVVDEAEAANDDEAGGEQPRTPNGQWAPKKAADDAADEPEQPQEQRHAPEWMTDWTDAQRAAISQLPPEAQAILAQPELIARYGYEQAEQQYRPHLEAAQPWLDALGDEVASYHLHRCAKDFGISPQQALSNMIETDSFLRYGPTDQRLQLFSDLAQAYFGRSLEDLALGIDHEGNKLDFRQADLQRQLADQRFQNSVIQDQMVRSASVGIERSVREFASATSQTGEPLRPLMAIPAVMHSMSTLIGNGSAHSLEQAYQMAAAPFEAEIAKRVPPRQAPQIDDRDGGRRQRNADRIEKARRARPIKSQADNRDGVDTGVSLEDMVRDVMDEAAA